MYTCTGCIGRCFLTTLQPVGICLLVLLSLYYLHSTTQDFALQSRVVYCEPCRVLKSTALCVVTCGVCRKDVAGDLLQINAYEIYY